jgi:hypothetical protein
VDIGSRGDCWDEKERNVREEAIEAHKWDSIFGS